MVSVAAVGAQAYISESVGFGVVLKFLSAKSGCSDLYTTWQVLINTREIKCTYSSHYMNSITP